MCLAVNEKQKEENKNIEKTNMFLTDVNPKQPM